MVLNTESIESTATAAVVALAVGFAWCLLDIGTAVAVVASCLCFVGAFEDFTVTECRQFATVAFTSSFRLFTTVASKSCFGCLEFATAAAVVVKLASASCSSTVATAAVKVE